GGANDYRNPLGGSELYASNLGRKFPEDSPENTTCKKIIAAAASLNRIVTDMLTFTRSRPPQMRRAQLLSVVRGGGRWTWRAVKLRRNVSPSASIFRQTIRRAWSIRTSWSRPG
ncbi:MAG: hypothetical protein LUG50_11565, partial [Planctomycetaceae bacterium]|nr:hypothetical protein [Planctomycetaceae bacterium]